jgi:hypothetical protein
MDLKTARDQNAIADVLTRASMAACFAATSIFLTGALLFHQKSLGLHGYSLSGWSTLQR